jgi:ferrous-iron efflux pump FieF
VTEAARLRAEERGRLTARAAIASAIVATFLLLLKAGAAWKTGSASMLGSLADTGLDLVASLITLGGVRIAAAPADFDHRFGHGKAEAIAALFQVVLISVSAIGIAVHAAQQLAGNAATGDAEYGIGVSAIAIVTTFLLLAYQRRVIAATGSVAIATDNVHYKSDLMLNLAVIAALAIDQFAGLRGADALFGIGIAGWLLFGAWSASTTAIDQLMDKEWPEEKRQRFLAVAAQHPELRGIHDLRTRTSGARDFVQFQVWVDKELSIFEAHRIMDEVEAKLALSFPDVEILIHPEPEGHVGKAFRTASGVPREELA